tara:strand:+ start:511 stop:894 length:384 start_codon:yes stop_codon:yes gene_type:complete
MGSMIFFTTVVSPTTFQTLNNKDSSNFLRSIFPKLFLFAFIISILSLLISIFNDNLIVTILLIFVTLSFLFNRNFLTPLINKFRDLELTGDKVAKKKFKLMHFLSVFLFIVNFLFLSCILIINYNNF